MTEGIAEGFGYGKVMFCGGYCVLEEDPICVMWSIKNAKISSKLIQSESKVLTVRSDIDMKPFQYASNGSKITGIKNPFLDTFFSVCPPSDGGELFISTDTLFGDKNTKTGLGSSSALVASLADLYKIHPIIAKKIHYIASSYSGSGSDVMSSFNGTMIFHSPLNLRAIKSSPNSKWRYWMISVPSMKGTDTRERIKIWKTIDAQYKVGLQEANKVLCKEFEEGNITKSTVQKYREEQQKMSLCGLKIEPKEWTDILDELNANPKVVAAVCPGSGGYDSAVMIATDEVVLPDHLCIRELFLRFV